MANRCGAQPSATEQNQPLGFKLDLSRFRFTAELLNRYKLKGLILAQNERWRRGLGMQVEREVYFGKWTAAKGTVMCRYLPPDLG